MRLDGRKVIEFVHSAWSIFHSKLKAGITDEDIHTYKQTYKPDQTSRQVRHQTFDNAKYLTPKTISNNLKSYALNLKPSKQNVFSHKIDEKLMQK